MNDTLKEQIISVCRLLSSKGFVAATDGNVSVRLENGTFLTTRSAIPKGIVSPQDILEVDKDGQVISREDTKSGYKPSTELGMHLSIYEHRSDVHAVVHAHPLYATGFAAAGQSLQACVFPEVIVGLGAIPLAEYSTPSTEEVAESLLPYIKTSDAILLANHGVVTYGKDVFDAYYKMEKVEHAAHILFIARMLGGEKLLTKEDLEKLSKVSIQSYGRDISQKISCVPEDECEDETKMLIRKMLRL